MRNLKWISLLTILAMLFAMLTATVAEDGIVIDPVEVDGEALEIEMDDVELLDSVDDSALALEDATIELDGLENDLLISETVEAANAPVASNASGDFVIDEYGTLTRYAGFAKNVVIPDGVKAISGAFSGYRDLESVSIPSSVTSIGDYSFNGCTSLKSVSIPDSVTSILWYAFSGCTALSNVSLPSTLKTLGYHAFYNCTSLKSIEIPDSVTRIDSYVFKGCTSLTSIKLPKSMTELSGGLFADCDSLDNLDFLSGVTKIDVSLFNGCDGLKNIAIPNSVTSIGSGVFGNCDNLESVTIHSGVTFIDRTAFDSSNNVTIRGTAGSYAESYANGMDIPFNAPVVTFEEETTRIYDDSGSYDALILYINHSRTLNAIQKPSDLARTLSWSSSDTGVVTVDKDGKIKGVAPGTATITANTADGKGKAAEIKVFIPEPSSIELYYNYWSGNKTVTLYQTSSISASTDTPYQYKTKVEMPITWSSSDASIISIEKSEANEATLKGNKLGKATITATTPDGGKASMELEVIRPEVNDIKIDQTGPITLHPGDQTKLTATLSPKGAESALTWSSYDTNVATVGSDGTVTAVAEGYTEVWVQTTNVCVSGIVVNVIPLHPHPTDIKIDQSSPITLHPGDQTRLTTTLSPEDAESTLTWGSYDTSIATIGSDGTVTAVAEGYTWIWVQTDNGLDSGMEVYVTPLHPHPTGIKIDQSSPITLHPGDQTRLTATLSPEGAESALTWGSYDTSIATIGSDGTVTAVAEGYTAVWVQTSNGYMREIEVNVIPLHPHPDSISIDQSSPAQLFPGEQLTLTTTMSPADAEAKLTWSSGNSSVATVSDSGLITAVSSGSTTIRVETDNGRRAYFEVYVYARPESITLPKYSGTLLVGQKCRISASVSPSNAKTSLTWNTSDDTVFRIEECDSYYCNFTTLKAGNATITVNTDNGKTASINLTVIAYPTNVKLAKATIGVKEKRVLKVTLAPADATTTLTWKSSAPKIAAVTKKGVVVGKKVGTAVITVTAANGYSAEATITVKAAPDSVTLSKSGTVTLKRGKTLKLKATLPKKTASALTWKSSKPKIASVDQKGVVRALNKGTAVITVKTFNGKTAKVTIRVK